MAGLKDIQVSDLQAISGNKILLNVSTGGLKLTEWTAQNAGFLENLTQANGALLVRGLKVMSSKQFSNILTAVFGEELINYTYRSTPRTELKANIYTATEYHSGETIPQHNEQGYSNNWPLRIGFLCILPSSQGGETPLADSRRVYEAVDPQIRKEFEDRKVMYVRNYGELDLPWSEVFQTEDKDVVEAYCKANHIKFEWLPNNGLRTRQVNNAVERHPVTDEPVWFNQAHLFHVSNLDQELKDSLLAVVGEESLPRNSYFGDGSPLDPEALAHIRQVYEKVQFTFSWEMHDLLLLDNMLYTHGRKPFSGNRKVLVGMARGHGSGM